MLTAGKPKAKPRLNRAEQREARTRDILDAAWVLYCEKGYEATTLEDVAAHAGISRMPVYKLFGDKQNLFFELARLLAGRLTDEMLASLEPDQPLRLNLERLAVAGAGSANAKAKRQLQGLFQVMHVIMAGRPDIAVKHRTVARKVIGDVAAMIAASTLARGERLRDSPERIAAIIVGLLNGLSTVEFETGKRYTVAADLASMFVHAALR